MPDLADFVELDGDSKPGGTAVSHLIDHLCWLLSRTLFLGAIVLVLVYFDIPLRSLIEGNAVQQMERAQTKALLDEAQLLNKMRAEMGKMRVALSTLRNAPPEGPETERARNSFANAASRFDELFASRSTVLRDQELEGAFYDIRDTSERLADSFKSNVGMPDRRKFCAQADLVEKLIPKSEFLARRYVCDRAGVPVALRGECQ